MAAPLQSNSLSAKSDIASHRQDMCPPPLHKGCALLPSPRVHIQFTQHTKHIPGRSHMLPQNPTIPFHCAMEYLVPRPPWLDWLSPLPLLLLLQRASRTGLGSLCAQLTAGELTSPPHPHHFLRPKFFSLAPLIFRSCCCSPPIYLPPWTNDQSPSDARASLISLISTILFPI